MKLIDLFDTINKYVESRGENAFDLEIKLVENSFTSVNSGKSLVVVEHQPDEKTFYIELAYFDEGETV